MIAALLGSLLLVAAYLGMRWNRVNVENTELRALVASLKRQLAKRGR